MIPQYAAILPMLRMAARHHGYALLVHGSGIRDLDLVAVPWVMDAVSAGELIDALKWITPRGVCADSRHPERGWWKPHGRRAYTILLAGDERPDGQLYEIRT